MRVKRLGTLSILGVMLAAGISQASREPYIAKGEYVLYVSNAGNDSWSGNIRNPNARKTDGPLASLAGARERIREIKGAEALKKPVRVYVTPGVYRLDEVFELYPEDSGTDSCPITYEGIAGLEGMPIISGGKVITGWKEKSGRFIAEVPGLGADIAFSSIWVNGNRRDRCRMPENGFFSIVDKAGIDGKDGFRAAPGDIGDWPDIDQAVIAIYHQWENSYHRIAGVDRAKSEVSLMTGARWPLWPRQRYQVENVRAAFDKPGEWYADEKSGTLEYIPMPGETLSDLEVVVPVLPTLISIAGSPEYPSALVTNVHFKGLRLQHAGFRGASMGHGDSQAAITVPSAVEISGARGCSMRMCELSALETHGIWIRRGSQGFVFEHNEIKDSGAGGVKVGETQHAQSDDEKCGTNIIRNNFIHDGTKLFHGGCGIWLGMTSGNEVTHNEISDMDYTGISVGWVWGYAESQANHNAIEYNHIHHLGRGLMSDMGGIYSLGVSPGTTERFNHIHDIYCYEGGYGGWGIYTDEGSTGITIENNLVYNTTSSGFHQHYGKENTVRNNIFAFGRDGQLQRTRMEPHISFTFENNIVLSNDQPFFSANWSDDKYILRNNLYWDYQNTVPDFYGYSLLKWQSTGRDKGSILADPLFADVLKGDFTLAANSPVLSLGFKPFDISGAGLYGEREWTALPAKVTRVDYKPAPPRGKMPIKEGFEDTPVGLTVEGLNTVEDGSKGTVRVTDETAALGKHSLKFTEEPGVKNSWDPHAYYSPSYSKGVIVEEFWLRAEPGTAMYHEWRDGASPYKVGPSIEVTARGKLRGSGKTLMDMPAATWVKFTIECGLGDQASGSYNLTVEIPGKTLEQFKLTCTKAFTSLRWLGWVSSGTVKGAFYIDEVSVRPKD